MTLKNLAISLLLASSWYTCSYAMQQTIDVGSVVWKLKTMPNSISYSSYDKKRNQTKEATINQETNEYKAVSELWTNEENFTGCDTLDYEPGEAKELFQKLQAGFNKAKSDYSNL